MDAVILEECEVCYARYSNTDLKCAECRKCICVSCFNNLREYKVIENEEEETSLYLNFKCPFCRCGNEKTSFENIRKETLLEFVKRDYYTHNKKIDEVNKLDMKYRIEKNEHFNTNQILRESYLKITEPTTNAMKKKYYKTVELLEDKIDKLEYTNKELREENSIILNLLKSNRERDDILKEQRIDNKKLKNIIEKIIKENTFFKEKEYLISNLVISTHTPKKILKEINKIIEEQNEYLI
jgi:hypothetical protein